MSGSRKVKVGLVGAGYVSAYHLRALKTISSARVVGIADLAMDRAQQLASQFGVPRAYATLEEMREARPNVIHVLTPPASHCAVTLEALAMGCDVFVEKPMAPTTAECDRMIEAAHRAGRILSVNHSAPADPIIVHAVQQLRHGACGDVLSVDFYRSSDYPPYPGGRVPAHYSQGGYPFQDIGVHALCLMEAFLGRLFDVDVRFRSTGHDPGVFFDEWNGTVQCRGGVGRFCLSWSSRPIRNELFIHGTRGYMHVDCFLQTCTVHKALPGPKAVQASVDATLHALGTLYTVPLNVLRFATGKLKPSPGILAGVAQFHEALALGADVPVAAEDGRRIVAWTEAASRRADADRDVAFRVYDALPPARVLVTGASGFLGRALLERLRVSGEVIRVLARRPTPALEGLPHVQVVYGDLGDPEAVDRAIAGVELVYHVGATMKGRGWADFQAGTVAGATNVVQSCLRHHVNKLVYVSSMSVLDYAAHKPGSILTEDAPLEPHAEQRGFYTQSKLQAEQIVREAARDAGLPVVVLRPGQIFGRGAESVPPYGTLGIAGRWVIVGSGNATLPLVYIEDVVDALLAAAARPMPGGSIVHLVDPTPITQNQYVEMCQRRLNGRLRVLRAPRALLYAAGIGIELLARALRRSAPLSRYRVRSIKEIRFDCTKAESDLGWRPAVGVRAGLETTFQNAAGPEAIATAG